MERRKIRFGSYNTAEYGWTLTGWTLEMPEYKSNFVTVPGRDGDLDASTALTDGVPKYGNRTLTVTLECSEGTRIDRETRISTMVNRLDGRRMDIRLPDEDYRYLTGRVAVRPEYSDMAHAAVTVTAICDPWRYNEQETALVMAAGDTEQTARLTNEGRRTVVPLLEITGDLAQVLLTYDTYSWTLCAGTYQLPDLIVPQGGISISYSGSGTLRFSYREAIL